MTDIYYLGIDGGGTSCRARITDQDLNIIGQATVGSANLFQDETGALNAVTQAAKQAADSANLSLNQLIAGIGLAGAGFERTRNVLKQWNHPFKSAVYATDAKTACIGAHLGEPGAILIVGTGICGWIENQEQSKSISGWGFPVADQGSGAWLGLRAIQETFNHLDGLIPASALSQTVLARFNNNADEIIEWTGTASSGEFGQLAPIVLQCADEGDAIASLIQDQQLEIVSSLLLRIEQQNPSGNLSVMGGLADRVLQQLKSSKTVTSLPAIKVTEADALTGAILMAKNQPNMSGNKSYD